MTSKDGIPKRNKRRLSIGINCWVKALDERLIFMRRQEVITWQQAAVMVV